MPRPPVSGRIGVSRQAALLRAGPFSASDDPISAGSTAGADAHCTTTSPLHPQHAHPSSIASHTSAIEFPCVVRGMRPQLALSTRSAHRARQGQPLLRLEVIAVAVLSPLLAATSPEPLRGIPLPGNPQTHCTPTYQYLWEDTHRLSLRGGIEWEGNIIIVGCLEQLNTLSKIGRLRAQTASITY